MLISLVGSDMFIRDSKCSFFFFETYSHIRALNSRLSKISPQLESKSLHTSEECFKGKRDDDDENIICYRLYSQEYSYGRNISMMWYVGCPLLSVDIIKVMRLVGEGGTNILLSLIHISEPTRLLRIGDAGVLG